MQWGEVYYYGDDCEATRSGTHHYEDMQDGKLWCRMCGKYIEDESEVKNIITKHKALTKEQLPK